MSDWLAGIWYDGRTRGLWALVPLSQLYRAAVAIRRRLYRGGLLPRYAAGVPVIVVGNVTVGGTGKTPMVLWLAERLSA
ncbi:MAG: tetraacyldisaccharide 4'-kinase, partial [Gammaproteobacteria bacterium]|nr:tetraacyldisaccharide 4'-kinase [Gammaproteobacteria bacterium]